MRQLLIILPLLALLGLSGCKTTSSVEEQSFSIRDSVRITDSVRVRDSVRVKTSVRDSVNIRDSLVIRLDSEGNEKSRESWHQRDTYHWQSDSVMELKLMLKQAIQDRDVAISMLKKHKEIVVREPSLTEKLRLVGSGVLLAVIAAVVIFAFTRKRNEISF